MSETGWTEGDPVITVIMCTRNGARYIPESMGAILDQEWDSPWEVVVVDNDSDDTTPALLASIAEEHARVRVVPAVAMRNTPYARNVGVEAARGRFITFMDDDDVVEPGWLRALGTALEDHPVVAMRVDVDTINPPLVAATRRPPGITGIGSYRGIPVVTTQMAVRRDWYLAVGGFDEQIPGPAGEDTDFALRLWDRYRSEPYWAEDAVVHYRLRGEPRVLLKQGFRYGRVHPILHKRWDAQCPEPGPTLALALKEWAHLVLRAPVSLLKPETHLRWYFRVGVKYGRLVGSVRYRTLML